MTRVELRQHDRTAAGDPGAAERQRLRGLLSLARDLGDPVAVTERQLDQLEAIACGEIEQPLTTWELYERRERMEASANRIALDSHEDLPYPNTPTAAHHEEP